MTDAEKDLDGPPTWVVGARSETGYTRGENQDRMSRVTTGIGDVFIVSDGMGGHKGGAAAAAMTVDTIQKHLVSAAGTTDVGGVVREAVQAANEAVYTEAHRGDVATEGMGATALVLVTRDAAALIAHVGDSRAYLFREGELKRLTIDHTRVQRMIDAKMLSPKDAEAHPDASLLERAIGHKPEIEVEVAPWLKLQTGDHLILCSDGLSGYVEDDEIAAVMASDGSPQVLVDDLVRLSLTKGGNDNVTVQVIRYGDPMANVSPARMFLYQAAFLPLSALVAGIVAYAVGQHGFASQFASMQQRIDHLGETSATLERTIARLETRLPVPTSAEKASDNVPPHSADQQAPAPSGMVDGATLPSTKSLPAVQPVKTHRTEPISSAAKVKAVPAGKSPKTTAAVSKNASTPNPEANPKSQVEAVNPAITNEATMSPSPNGPPSPLPALPSAPAPASGGAS